MGLNGFSIHGLEPWFVHIGGSDFGSLLENPGWCGRPPGYYGLVTWCTLYLSGSLKMEGKAYKSNFLFSQQQSCNDCFRKFQNSNLPYIYIF